MPSTQAVAPSLGHNGSEKVRMFDKRTHRHKHRDPSMYVAYGPRGRHRNQVVMENSTWSQLDRNTSAIARCTITSPVLSERRSFKPSFRSSLKKIGESVSVHQLAKISWIFWAKSWIFWASDFEHVQASPHSKRNPAWPIGVYLSVYLGWYCVTESLLFEVLPSSFISRLRGCLLLEAATRAMVRKFKASCVPNSSKK